MSENITISELFPARFLKPTDLDDGDLVLTIDRVTVEDLGRGDRKELKAIVHFTEIDKGLVLNKTNASTIAKLHGDQTIHWTGKKITLYLTEVEFQGTQMLGIRVRLRAPTQQQKPTSPIPEPSDFPDPWA